MYEMSPEDARSDLLLSAAVFVFGPFALQLLLQLTGMGLGRTSARLVSLVVIVLCTVVVPLLLMKYRNERPARVLGLGGGDPSVAVGLVAAVPLLVAGAIQFVAGGNPLSAHPVEALAVGDGLLPVMRLAGWLGVVALGLYVTVKARDAFGGLPVRVEEAVWRIGRILALAAAATTLLGVVSVLTDATRAPVAVVGVVAAPLAVAAAIWLVLQRTAGPSTTAMPVLITPTALFAVGGLAFPRSLDTVAPVLNALVLSAGLGLAVGVLAERTRRGGGVLLLAVLLALGTSLVAPVRF